MTIGPNGRVSLARNVSYRQFDSDVVMVDLEGGEYFALDAIGGQMWHALVAGKSPAEIGENLAHEYEASEEQIIGDCVELADDLLRRGLLVRHEP